jgi:hypothetical protein
MANHLAQLDLQNELAADLSDIEGIDDTDAESIASLETDDGERHAIERILAEIQGNRGQIYYLVKWENCPLVRSSWETSSTFIQCPHHLEDWTVEKQKVADGKSQPFNIAALNQAIEEIELAERQRRILRRFKRRVQHILEIVSAD